MLVILILIIIVAYAWLKAYRRREISSILSISLLFYLVFWNFFPVIYSYIRPEKTAFIKFHPIYRDLVIVQLASILIILLMFGRIRILISVKKYLEHPNKSKTRIAYSRYALYVASVSMVFSIIYSIGIMGHYFLEQVSFVVSEENLQNPIGSGLGMLTMLALSYSISFLLFSKSSLKNRSLKILALANVIFYIYYRAFVSGSRASLMLLPIILILTLTSKSFHLRRSKRIALIFISVLLFLVAPFFSLWIQRVRTASRYDMGEIVQQYQSQQYSSVGEEFVNDWYTKFSSLSNGAMLLELEGKGRVGLSLIKSSFFGFIPRIVFPNKPMPFSINDNYSGVPYYYVSYIIGSSSESAVNPVAPTAIALWEMGYFSLFIMILLNVINLLIINTLLLTDSLFYKSCGIVLMSMPTFEFLISPSGLIIKEGLRVTFIIFTVHLIRIFYRYLLKA